ncbi:hypothetical protein BC833DRAFT_620851 [Globomyces pollinis-pini]|nr:hypothetical protein BC833DRAFT_620851 [Globomyces pollinis-pini]
MDVGGSVFLSKMCQKTECPTCKKPTWKGCGQHIEQALAGVPVADRCQCPRKDVHGKEGTNSQQRLNTIKHSEEPVSTKKTVKRGQGEMDNTVFYFLAICFAIFAYLPVALQNH